MFKYINNQNRYKITRQTSKMDPKGGGQPTNNTSAPVYQPGYQPGFVYQPGQSRGVAINQPMAFPMIFSMFPLSMEW